MMNKSLSQAYLFQSKMNDDFFITDNHTDSKKCYDLSCACVRIPKEIINKKNGKIDLTNYTFSLNYDTYSDISERYIYKSHALHEKCRNSKSSDKSHFINESLSSHNHSSLHVKNILTSNNKIQTFSPLHNSSRIWMDWRQFSDSSLNRSHIEKSNLTPFNSFNSSVSRFSSSYTCIPFSKHNDLSSKLSLRSFNSSLALSNNNMSPLNSPQQSFKSENTSIVESFPKQKYTFTNTFLDFYTTESKPNLSKRKTYPLLKKTNHHGKPISLLHASTIHLVSVFKTCNPKFNYEPLKNSKKVLTKPNIGIKNDGYDNENNDYILYVNDILGSDKGHRYLILDILGQGTFGQVVKCRNIQTQEIVAVKVIKNKPAYFNQSMMEITILDLVRRNNI
ncbi:hypothetical protein PCK2_000295 [Pneumocystis canis]|nr:hypothetical protein PCK2_000295 [Pneumocystis canis]